MKRSLQMKDGAMSDRTTLRAGKELPMRMAFRVCSAALVSALVLMLAMAYGCASVKPDEHFPDVQGHVTQRLDRRLI